MIKKKLLLLTLVHPDFLPPVYATAQVLRDEGYEINILTFDSFVPAKLDIGESIYIETLGEHYKANALDRINFRQKFIRRAKELIAEKPRAIIAFCPFSYLCALTVKKKIPLVYIALEVADFIFSDLFRSPLSNYRNLIALKNIKKADLLATPSIQRSAWLAGRCRLNNMPYTILNTAYIKNEDDTYNTFRELVPVTFLSKKIVLYTGAVNSGQCILELVRAFDMVNAPDSALIITGVRNDEYCDQLKELIQKCKTKERILTFPYVTRAQMLALQSNSHIGACLVREFQDHVKSKMMAPNKIGEYVSKKLYILGISSEYLNPLRIQGFASLADFPTPRNISKALKEALNAINAPDFKEKIALFVKNDFCMQQQLKPVINFIKQLPNVE